MPACKDVHLLTQGLLHVVRWILGDVLLQDLEVCDLPQWARALQVAFFQSNIIMIVITWWASDCKLFPQFFYRVTRALFFTFPNLSSTTCFVRTPLHTGILIVVSVH